MTLDKRWDISEQNPILSGSMANELGVSPLVAQLLINRGITNPQDARDFLYAGPELLGSPFALKDMDKAVERIQKAIADREKIVIYGDFDVDGITSTSLLVRVLRKVGADVQFYIPERKAEGYGLNSQALLQKAKEGVTVVITVDCGISSFQEALDARQHGIDLIVTDHHQPHGELPEAYAVVNPKRGDCTAGCTLLAGVGVAFKLGQALALQLGWQPTNGTLLGEYLDLVALGTIADIVPLTGENRALVKAGLDVINTTDKIGLAELMKVTGLERQRVDAGQVAFVLAPRLNAAGRIGHAGEAVELLLTEDRAKAKLLAEKLNQENQLRQVEERAIFEQVAGIVQNQYADTCALVVEGEEWHPGVIGIVASRVVERFYRPTVVISICDGVGKGSCRSIAGFDIHAALTECADLLEKFGGHKQAAGLTINPANIPLLRQRLSDLAAQWLTEEDLVPKLSIDALITLKEINQPLIEQVAALAPFGMSNPAPLFAGRNMTLHGCRAIGQEGRHLKAKVAQAQASISAVAWGMGEMASCFSETAVDAAFVPELNRYNGRQELQMVIKHMRPTGQENTLLDRLFESMQRITLSEQPEPGQYKNLQKTQFVNAKRIDVQNRHDKLIYVKEAVMTGKQVLVLVQSPSAAYRLSQYVRSTLPGKEQTTAFWFVALPDSGKAVVRQLLEEGVVTVVVATYGGVAQLPDIAWSDIVLFHTPNGNQ